MGFLKRGVALATGIVIAAAQLFAVTAPASAYGSVTLGSGSSSNTFTAPTAPVTSSISGGQRFAFQYPGGVFEVGAPTNGSTTITVNAYKNGALDTTFNTTGSVSFTSQLATSNRSWLEMTTYANGSKWAILDTNSAPTTGYNFLYLGTFAGGYQSTVTLPTTESNYNTCTTKLNSVSNGTYTSNFGSFSLVPNTGFATPVISIDCTTYLNSAGSSYTSVGKFFVQYSGGATIGTPASLSSFTTGGTFANGYQAIGANSSKTLTSFGMSVNPNATGSQVAITFVDGLSTGFSYSDTTAFDTTPYSNFVITRITAAGDVSFTLSAFSSISVGSRTGTVVVPPRNNGTVYALQHATDGTTAIAKVLTISSTGVATATTVTGVNLTSSINRIAPQTSPGNTVKLASLNDGSPSYYYHLNGSTAVMTQVSNFTTSGGFSYPELLWGMADNSDGSDFYARSSGTGIIRVATTTAPQAPAAPASPSITKGHQSVYLSWSAPTNNGAPITNYSVQISSNGGTSWTLWATNIVTTETIVTGLTNGLTYHARVAATNSVGTSAWSSNSSGAIPEAVPDQPVIASVTYASANSATVSWPAPNDNGYPILTYQLHYSTNNGVTWNSYSSQNSTTQIALTLTSGISYIFRAVALNSIGSSFYSTPSNAYFVADIPSAPSAPTATRGDTQVSLVWVAPSNGGCAITGYRIEFSTNNGATWQNFTSAAAGTSAIVTGLTNGLSHTFRIGAQNCNGWSPFSPGSASVTPSSVPAAPTNLTISGGVGSQLFALNWSAPSSSLPITDYRIEYANTANGSWTIFSDSVSSATTANVGTFTLGSTLFFRVSAINAVGVGGASSVTGPVIVSRVPSAPAAPAATSSPGSLILTWVAPVTSNAPTTGAHVYYSTNQSTWIAYGGPVDLTGTVNITGLATGQTYFFRVEATNFFGTSPVSGTSSGVLAQAPTAPSVVSQVNATTGSATGSANLTWNAPAANGSAIMDYLIEYSSDGGVTWTSFVHPPSAATSITVTGLNPAAQYQFRVKAINGVGTAAAGASSLSVQPPAAPAVSSSEATLQFIASLKPGGKVNATDGKLTIDGENMDKVTKVLMNSVDAPIVFRTSIALTVQIPATVIGWVDIEFVTDNSKIRFQNFVYVNNNKNQIAKLGIGFAKVKTKVSTSILKTNSTIRLAKQTPNFALASSASCVGFVGKGMTQREALDRARHTCEQLTLRYPRLTVQLATTKSILRAHVLVLFKY